MVKKKLAAEEEECKVYVPFERSINSNTRKLEYRRRKFEWKEPLHWGQIKLFIAELEFLTAYGHLSNIIVYAGSSDGAHIPFVANIFKNHTFLLWDPLPMAKGYEVMPNMQFHQEIFTDEIASSLLAKHGDVLFISDIRSMPSEINYGSMTPDLDDELEEDIKRDMQTQKIWCEIMQPAASMLKFRLPYIPGTTEYLAGDVRFQAFAAETSSETRLVISKTEHGYVPYTYDHELYENHMYRFNRCTRIQPVEHFTDAQNEITKAEELKELFDPLPLSYDVLTLVHSVQKYIDAHDPQSQPGEIIYHLLRYIGSSFERKYEKKKKLHEIHMSHSKLKYENKEVL
jgi:hypothetical protein